MRNSVWESTQVINISSKKDISATQELALTSSGIGSSARPSIQETRQRNINVSSALACQKELTIAIKSTHGQEIMKKSTSVSNKKGLKKVPNTATTNSISSKSKRVRTKQLL